MFMRVFHTNTYSAQKRIDTARIDGIDGNISLKFVHAKIKTLMRACAMSNAAVEITNLLYRYAEFMDSGDFESIALLFRHARIKTGDSNALTDADGVLASWRNVVRLYPCGTPRTKHVVTNPILDIDEGAGTATCRSYYTVLQSTDTLPLQPVAAGRYHDEFERVDGKWRFSYRDYSLFDHVGDISQHLKNYSI